MKLSFKQIGSELLVNMTAESASEIAGLTKLLRLVGHDKVLDVPVKVVPVRIESYGAEGDHDLDEPHCPIGDITLALDAKATS
jgi:hypothetical protein